MLFILAEVAAIFFVIAHYVPGFIFVITCVSILLAFAGIGIFVLRVTGIIDNTTFKGTLDSLLKAVPVLTSNKDSDSDDTTNQSSLPKE